MTWHLAIDTATDWGSVAIAGAGTVLAEISLGPRRHARGLVPAIEECLRIGEGTMDGVGEVVLADGPGSFTGLRIGAATVKGLLAECPELSVGMAPSLMAAAWGAAHTDEPVAALYDALRGEVFGAVYQFTDRAVTVHVAPTLTTVERLRTLSPVVPVLAVGDGAVVHPDAVRSWTGRHALGPPRWFPRAAHLFPLRALAGGVMRVPDPIALEPTYGRPAEAQLRWERKHGRPLHDSPGGQ